MNKSRIEIKLAAIASGLGLLIAGTVFAYWQVSRRYWCVHTLSNSDPEVVFTWGCLNPQRYRQWSTNAQRPVTQPVVLNPQPTSPKLFPQSER